MHTFEKTTLIKIEDTLKNVLNVFNVFSIFINVGLLKSMYYGYLLDAKLNFASNECLQLEYE